MLWQFTRQEQQRRSHRSKQELNLILLSLFRISVQQVLMSPPSMEPSNQSSEECGQPTPTFYSTPTWLNQTSQSLQNSLLKSRQSSKHPMSMASTPNTLKTRWERSEPLMALVQLELV